MAFIQQEIQDLIAFVSKWDIKYAKNIANSKNDPTFKQQLEKVTTLRNKLIASISESYQKEEGTDNAFSKMSVQQKALEANRSEIHRFINKINLKERPIFMTPRQFDLIQSFLDKAYNFALVEQKATSEIKEIFAKLTNNYPKRLRNHHKYFKSLVPHIGLLADDNLMNSPAPGNNLPPQKVVVTPPKTIPTTVSKDKPKNKNTEAPILQKETPKVSPPIAPKKLVSNQSAVNKLLAYRADIFPVQNQATDLFEAINLPRDKEESIIITMENYISIYNFINPFYNFNWKFQKSSTATIKEFETLTKQWQKQTNPLFERILAVHARFKMIEKQTNRLAESKPLVNHNIVAQIDGEDPHLSFVYQKIDRFIANEDGRRYKKMKVNPKHLFVKGKDDTNSSGIDPYDMIQGALGDCYFMCSLSALAKMQGGINRIKDMITYHRNGTFSVQLYRPSYQAHIESFTNPETGKLVKQNTKKLIYLEAVEVIINANVWVDKLAGIKNQALYARSQDTNEIWPLILEKAFAKLMGGYDEIDAGFAKEAFEILTGIPRRSFSFSSENDRAISEMKKAFVNQRAVTFATPPHISANHVYDKQGFPMKGNAGETILETYPEDGKEYIVAGHAYALDAIHNDTVTLINPHGKNHIKKMPVASLYKYFSRVVVDY